MVANPQTFNQRNDNNDKDNDGVKIAPNVVDEKSHWAQFAAPGPFATSSSPDAETLVDAARAGVDETPDEAFAPNLEALKRIADKVGLKTYRGTTKSQDLGEIWAKCLAASSMQQEAAGGGKDEIERVLNVAQAKETSGDSKPPKRPAETNEASKRRGFTKTIIHYGDGELACWFPDDVDAGAELLRFVKAATKTSVRVALDGAKSRLLTQILTLPTPRSAADIRRYYHQTVQGLALNVVAELGSDDEQLAVVKYLASAMGSRDDAESTGEEADDAKPETSPRSPLDAIDREAFLKLGKFYNRVVLPFIREDAAMFRRILAATQVVFPPDELLRPWNVTDKVSAFCDALQNDGMTQAAALPIAKEAVEIATKTASAFYWDGAEPCPKQRWNVSYAKPTSDGDATSFTVGAAETEAGE